MAPPPPRAGDSPLHMAAMKGHTATAEALLAAGANVNLQNNDGAWARAVELGVATGGMRRGGRRVRGVLRSCERIRHGEGARMRDGVRGITAGPVACKGRVARDGFRLVKS